MTVSVPKISLKTLEDEVKALEPEIALAETILTGLGQGAFVEKIKAVVNAANALMGLAG